MIPNLRPMLMHNIEEIHVYTHSRIHVYVHAHTHIYMHTCTHTHTCTYIHVHTHIHTIQKLLRDGKIILQIRRSSDALSPSTSSSSLPHHPLSTSSLSEVTSPRSPPGLQLMAQVADVLCEDEEEEEEEETQLPNKRTGRVRFMIWCIYSMIVVFNESTVMTITSTSF